MDYEFSNKYQNRPEMCYNGICEDIEDGNRQGRNISKLIPTLNSVNDCSEEITNNLKAIKQKLKEYVEEYSRDINIQDAWKDIP